VRSRDRVACSRAVSSVDTRSDGGRGMGADVMEEDAGAAGLVGEAVLEGRFRIFTCFMILAAGHS